VRGLASLMVLREIMDTIKHKEGLQETPRPCQHFDLIGGTSTGGLIALMLGRLGMVWPTSVICLINRRFKNVSIHTKNYHERSSTSIM